MKRILFAICALCSAYVAVAQSNVASRTNTRGILMNADIMSVAQMSQFAQSTFQYGTARSMAMAGAMTSLGGDASSMMINPAGLGMYRSNNVTLTPMVTVQNSDTQGGKYFKGGDNSFAMGNLSAVFNIHESSDSPLISLNFGFGYNKISNLNYNYSTKSLGNSGSIARMFARQLTGDGVTLDELYGNSNPDWNNIYTNSWGAALGYKMGLTFQSYGSVPKGYENALPNDVIKPTDTPIWNTTWIGDNALIDQYFEADSEGSVGEYNFAIGGDIMNKLYFGFTFGVQHVYQRLDLLYGEEYDNNVALENSLLYANYNQNITTSGAGVNLKMGVTYRPVESVRIGIAYHTPTWYSLNRLYQGSMASAAVMDGETTYGSAESPVLEDFGENKWRFNSPSRLLLGGSVTIKQRALVSVDYQRDAYGSMKVRKLPFGVDNSLYSGFDDVYQTVNTLRFGAELRLSPQLYLRGGYGHSSSMLRDGVSMSELLDNPTVNRVNYYSAGIGYSFTNKIGFDLTYMNQHTDMSRYTLFYASGELPQSVLHGSAMPSAESAQSGTFKSDLKAHNIALSMVIKM